MGGITDLADEPGRSFGVRGSAGAGVGGAGGLNDRVLSYDMTTQLHVLFDKGRHIYDEGSSLPAATATVNNITPRQHLLSIALGANRTRAVLPYHLIILLSAHAVRMEDGFQTEGRRQTGILGEI